MAGIAALVPFAVFRRSYLRFVSCGLHVIVPAGENVEGAIQSAGQQHQFSQGAGRNTIRDLYHTDRYNRHRVSAIEIYAAGLVRIR